MAPPLPPYPRIDFFGRSTELETLVALHTAVEPAHGRGRAALVTGPAGVGKSKLLSELKRKLKEAGHPVLEGRCRAADHRPHGTLVDLIGAIATLLQDLGRASPYTQRALTLISGLNAEPPGPTDASAPALELYESVRHSLIEAGRGKAPAIFLHDLHRADEEMLALTRYLLDNLLTDPAFDWAPEAADRHNVFRGLLVCTFRLNEHTEGLLSMTRASESVVHLPLRGLNAEGVASFLSSDRVIHRLLTASRGLPVALEQLIESLPDRAEKLWHRRLADLSAQGAEVLNALAAYARPCSVAQIIELAALDFDPRPVLGELLERQILVQSLAGGQIQFRFNRAGARRAYYERMTTEGRADAHRRIAERLAMAGALGVEPAEIANHYLEAGCRAEAVPFAIQAADRLESARSHRKAAQLLESVLCAAAGDLRRDVLDRLARLHVLTGNLTQAAVALDALRASGVDDDHLAMRAARLSARAGKHADVFNWTSDRATAAGTPTLRLGFAALAAEAAYQLGQLDKAEALGARLEEARDGGHAAGSSAFDLRNTLGKVHLAREALDEARICFETNLAFAEAARDGRNTARALINLGVVDLQRGAPDEALIRFEAARENCEARGDARNLAFAVENLAVLHHRRQAFDLALARYHQSSAAFRQLGHRSQLATTALNLADLYLIVGELDRSRRLAAIAGELIVQDGLLHLEAQRLTLEGDLAQMDGQPDAAATLYTDAMELLDSGSNQRLGSILWSLAEVELSRDDGRRCLELVERASALPAAQGGVLAARLRMIRGAARLALDDLEGGRADLMAAARLAEESDDREITWQTLDRLAEAHWVAKDRPATLHALAAAVDVIEAAAQHLPPTLQATYRDAPRRRKVREGLRRVRAGLSPKPAKGVVEMTTLTRETSGYRPVWAKRYPQLIGSAPSLYSVFNALDRVAGSDSMVLIRGESGTGKELVASALHVHSPSADGPFVKVNCAAFVETLLLSELFGHEKGAFTGAISSKKGRFELADGGTIFLDEIGDISPNTQVALLRVLQEGAFERVGGSQTLRVETRVICATHRNLEQMVRDNTFRADLYYRLRGVIIELPPLRKRREDIPSLVAHFLERRAQAGRPRLHFSRAALASLYQHDWPGNVRELENVVRSVALFADADQVDLPQLAELGRLFEAPREETLLAISELLTAQACAPADGLVVAEDPAEPAPQAATEAFTGADERGLSDAWLGQMLQSSGGLAELKKMIEYEAIARALRTSKGNITQAAKSLGMKRPRLSQIIHSTPALGELKREVAGT